MTDIPHISPVSANAQYVTREMMDSVLRSILGDLVTTDVVAKMVHAAVELRLDNHRTLITSIDTAQRNSFQDFKDASKDYRDSTERLNAALGAFNERTARIETGQAADRSRMGEAISKIDLQEARLDRLEERVGKVENANNELRIDIHGDVNQALRPSLHSMIRSLEQKVDGVNAGINTIKETQDRHESYINRRKNIEQWVKDVITSLWGNKVSRLAILSGLPVIGTVFASALDPRIGEAVAQFITSILTGK